MADAEKAKLRLEIAHVLFMDIVGGNRESFLIAGVPENCCHRHNRRALRPWLVY